VPSTDIIAANICRNATIIEITIKIKITKN